MGKPLVLYAQKYLHGFGESFTGYTPRKEHIVGYVSQRFICDSAIVRLVIDGVSFEAPNDMDYSQARNWLLKQVEDMLGYFVIVMPG